MLNLEIKRDENGIPLPLPQQLPIQNLRIDGFFPVINNIRIINLQFLLGIKKKEDSDIEVSSLN